MQNSFRLAFLSTVSLYASLPSFGFGKTLIVTHPECVFDSDRVAGPATRALVGSSDYCSKILLNGERGLHDLTFDSQGLSFQSIFSKAGEFVWNNSDNHVVLAGGFFKACQFSTLISLIAYTEGPLTIEISMRGTYGLRAVFFWEAFGRSIHKESAEGLEPYATLTLLEFYKEFGADATKAVVRNLAQAALSSAPTSILRYDPKSRNTILIKRSPEEIEITPALNHEILEPVGSGSQKIRLIFNENL